MTALDFPRSPAVNDEFTGGGHTWVWTGTVWNLSSSSGGGGGSTTTSVLFESNNNTLIHTSTNDLDTTTLSLTAGDDSFFDLATGNFLAAGLCIVTMSVRVAPAAAGQFLSLDMNMGPDAFAVLGPTSIDGFGLVSAGRSDFLLPLAYNVEVGDNLQMHLTLRGAAGDGTYDISLHMAFIPT